MHCVQHSTLLVLNRISLTSINALLALNWQYCNLSINANYHGNTTVNAVNFAGLIFCVWQHKNIFAGCWIRAEQMLTWYFCITQILDIIRYIYKQLGSTKTKQASHILQYITRLHQHSWAYKISQIFSRVFEFVLAEFCVKFAKINVPWIFPLLQYFNNKGNSYRAITMQIYSPVLLEKNSMFGDARLFTK